MFKWVGLHKTGWAKCVAYENCMSNWQQKIHHQGSLHSTSKACINITFHSDIRHSREKKDYVIYSNILIISQRPGFKHNSFEVMVLRTTLSRETRVSDKSPVMFVLATVYRPPGHHTDFIKEFADFLSELVLAADKVLIKKPTLNTSLLDNYRPVSLLPFVAKTLERVVFNQLSLFLSQYNKLDAKQSGFRSGHSTETALLSVTEALRVAKADSKSSVLILLDLSAAFVTVNHQILLSTLSSLGITGIPLRWFESYLTGRSFRVAWGGEVSKAHQLVTGVPQGSVLGPLLFSTYTTSLGPIMQAHGFSYHCYADDTHLYLSFQPDDPTVAARISGCLADISAWMKEHHLQLNLAKTELLVIPATPSLQHDFSIQLGTSIITPSTSVRNLGVIFDDQLTFKEHIAKTARSCRFALHNIRKIRPFLTEHAAQLLVQALVVSRLDYCNALLAGLPSNTIKPLQMIQNAAARLVFNEPKRTHVTPLFISLHWLPVAARIKFKTLMLAYRTTTGSAPSYFHSLLRIYIPSRSLRSASERRLVVPSQRGSKSLSRTFSFTIPGWWNNLPTPIRNAGSLSIFKQQLKTHLFRHYLTSS